MTASADKSNQVGKRQLPSVSVVVCCHNSEARLPKTLSHLAQQQVPQELVWEILVVDNASTDGTIAAVHEFSRQVPAVSVRIVSEPKLGTGYARQRGMAEATLDCVLFVDDDNWLAPDYLRILAETMKEHPEIEALGGMSTAECEIPEPAWFQQYQGWYAITGRPENSGNIKEELFLWTAGTGFRRDLLARITRKGFRFLVSGRRGDTLDAGEDHELCHLIRMLGGRLYRHSGLLFRHFLPARRLTWDYLRRLHYGEGQASVRLDAYRENSAESIWPAWLLRSWSAQLLNVCLQILRYRVVSLWPPEKAEADSRVLRLELYRGRLDGLWRHRRGYREMVSRAAVALNKRVPA